MLIWQKAKDKFDLIYKFISEIFMHHLESDDAP